MELLPAVAAAVLGYLAGSISFARIVLRVFRQQRHVQPITLPLPDGDVFVSTRVSATAVRMQAGSRLGCLTALLDMAKVAIPTLIVRLWAPEEPYFLIVAAAGVVGHDWPLFGRYKGGGGESPMYGGLIVIDPIAVVGTTLLGFIIGFALGNLLYLRWIGMFLLVPWLWFATGDPWYVAYMVFVIAVYFVAVQPERARYRTMLGGRTPLTNEQLADVVGINPGFGRAMDRYGLLPWIRRRRQGA